MRILWILIGLVILAGGFLLLSDGEEPAPTGTAATPIPVEADEGGPEDVSRPMETTAADLAEGLGADAEARVDAKSDSSEPIPPQSDPSAGTIRDGMDETIAHAEVVAGEITVGDDGALVVDGEWTLKGEGTREAPYEPSWEYLYSAADTYQPRLGENEIPQRIALLNDKWIRVAGFTAIPLLTGETTEMLVMLNKWDGCCLGVPPTPFDAIEVHLVEPVNRKSSHDSAYGTVMGRMKVDPYLIENWLVGLYILEESSIEMDL